MMNFPLSYLCLKIGFPPESVYVVGLLVSVACMLLRLLFLRKMVELSMKRFLKRVYGNIWMVSLVAAIVPFLIVQQMSIGWERFIVLTLLSVVCSTMSIYWIGCSQEERIYIRTSVSKVKQRIWHDRD